MAGYRQGDQVTVVPDDRCDPYIFQFQRYATVTRAGSGSYWIRLDSTCPPGQEFGPIPERRLLPGWKIHGQWRHW